MRTRIGSRSCKAGVLLRRRRRRGAVAGIAAGRRRAAARLMLLGLAGLVLETGCTVGPDYQRPAVVTPAAFKEQGPWKPAEPGDLADRGAWWSVYGDPLLDQLEVQIDVSNQNVKQYEAAYRQAAAVVNAAQGSYFPTVSASTSAMRSGTLNGERASASSRSMNSFSVGPSISWDADVWGKIRRTVESDVASAQASAADIAATRLSAQGTLASDYLALRVADETKRLYDATADAYQRSLAITQNQYQAGIVTRADVASAQAQLENARASSINSGVTRAQLEHAIAILIGKAPAEFSIAPVDKLIAVPPTPAAVPSTLLERRPDIAAAERLVAAKNAEIGVALAAYYPDITLSGSLDFSSSFVDTLLHASNGIWSLGPSVSQTLFDGGQRTAAVAEARAAYDQDVASYRQTVLSAFQAIEDDLAELRILAQQAEVQQRAIDAAEVSVRLNLDQYRAGTVTYTSVVTAQATLLTDQQDLLTIRKSLLAASVSLIQDLGGGWNAAQLPNPTQVEQVNDQPATATPVKATAP
ncbi:MAG: efflux transporter outer membrane subunit [Azospirillaceae bacterium]|nr:efflux transporter outer membrane subunit [Azospirillaceae bacterium]